MPAIDDIRKRALFSASCMALIVTAMTFAFRAGLETTWEEKYHLTKEQLGWIFSPAFWGFTLAMIFGGPLCDMIGMKRLLGLAFTGHAAGIIIYMTAGDANMLFAGTLCIGIGNGMVEAACNPLVVSLYPDNKTTMLNRFHVWFPGGIAIGGLLSYFLIGRMQLDWHWLMAILFIPAIIYGILFLRLKFPETERVNKGVSTGKMFRSCLNPLFLLMILCMMFTAATELGTGTWIQALLLGANVSGILVLVFINGIMAVGRSMASPIVHKLNPNGVLIGSAFFAALGLFLLSKASGTYQAFGSAFIFAAGVCFFWPTMLGFVSEYLPDTGAMGLSLMGGAGMFSVSLILPVMGKWFDDYKQHAIANGMQPTAADTYSGSQTFLKVAIMPAILLIIFIFIYFFRRKKYDAQQEHNITKISSAH
ncbi:MAG: MFS transporter [Ferruginibacter sp.]